MGEVRSSVSQVVYELLDATLWLYLRYLVFFMCDTLPIPMLFPMPTLWEIQIYLHSWYSYTKDCYSSIMSFSTGIGRFPCVVWLNFASLSHRILVQLQVILILLHFIFSSHCMISHIFLRICAFKRCDVPSIDSYSINDLYTCEVTWTFVVCHLLAFDIFNYYQLRFLFS